MAIESPKVRVHPADVVDEVYLFAYGSLMKGEVHASYLTDALRVGKARTLPGYRLVDLGSFPAMIIGGDAAVDGELYSVGRGLLHKLDELKESGRLFYRRVVQLEDGRRAETYLMDEDKLRGRRRLRIGDWRRRFERAPLGPRFR